MSGVASTFCRVVSEIFKKYGSIQKICSRRNTVETYGIYKSALWLASRFHRVTSFVGMAYTLFGTPRFDGIVLGKEGRCNIWNDIGTRRNIRAFHRY